MRVLGGEVVSPALRKIAMDAPPNESIGQQLLVPLHTYLMVAFLFFVSSASPDRHGTLTLLRLPETSLQKPRTPSLTLAGPPPLSKVKQNKWCIAPFDTTRFTWPPDSLFCRGVFMQSLVLATKISTLRMVQQTFA